jgi:malate dehydrogenase
VYLTDRKTVVLGAAGAIGSNLVQDLLSTRTANNITMYDPFEAGLQGAAEEIYHCGFPGARVKWTTSLEEALSGAAYIASSGGAPRNPGMTREDLLRGNSEIARELGQGIKQWASDAQFVVVVFNPADITGLIALVYSGLKPGRVSTLAALDSTRLQTRLSQYFDVPQEEAEGCATYGGHGEHMAVFKGCISVRGKSMGEILAGDEVNGRTMNREQWIQLKDAVRNGGAEIIRLRGRSSYQSPAHQTVEMIRRRIAGGWHDWPCGAYIPHGPFGKVMMAADALFKEDGIVGYLPVGDAEDLEALQGSYAHLRALRDEVIAAGILPPIAEWPNHNRYLA